MTRRTKQLLIGTGILLGLVLCLLAGVLVYLGTDHAHRLIQAEVNEAIPGSIDFESLRFSLVKGELEVRNVALRDPSQEAMAGFERLFVDFSWFPLLKGAVRIKALVLEKPWAEVESDRDGQLNLLRAFPPSKPEAMEKEPETRGAALPNVVLESVQITGGAFRYEAADPALTTAVRALDLSADANLAQRSGRLSIEIGKIDLKSPGIQTDVDRFKLSLALKEGRIDPLVWEVQTASSKLSLSGHIAGVFDRPTVDLALHTAASLSELQKSLDLKGDLEGQLGVHVAARGTLDNPDVTLQVDLQDGKVSGTRIESAKLDCRLEDRILVLEELQIAAAGGHMTGSGEADLRDAFSRGFLDPKRDLEAMSYRVLVEGKAVSLGELFTGEGMSGKVDAHFSFQGRGISPETCNAHTALDISVHEFNVNRLEEPRPLTVKGEADLDQGKATLKALEAKAGRLTIRSKGHFDLLSKELGGELFLESPDLNEALKPLGLKQAKGSLNMEAHVSGSAERPVFDFSLSGDQLRFQDIVLGEVRLAASLDQSGVLRISRLSLQNGGSSLTGQGTVHVFEKSFEVNPGLPMNVSMTIRDFEAKDFTAEEFIRGTIDGDLTLDGAVDALKGKLSLHARGLAAEGIRLGDADIDARLSEGTLFLDQGDIRNQGSQLRISGTARVLEREKLTLVQDPSFSIKMEGDRILIHDFFDQFEGDLSLRADLEGSLKELRGTIDLWGTALNIGVQKFHGLTLHAGLDGEKILLDTLKVEVTPDEVLEARGWLSMQKTFDITLVSEGISLKNLDKLRDEQIAEGRIVMDVAARGTADDPQIEGEIALDQLLVMGKPMEDFRVRLHVHDQVASLSGSLNFDVEASYHLRERDFSASLVFKETDLAPYFKVVDRPDFSGSLTGTIDMAGNAAAMGQASGKVQLSRMDVLFQDKPVIRGDHISASFNRDEVHISDLRVKVLEAGHIEVTGTGRREGPMAFKVGADIPLSLISLFVEDLADMQGNVLVSGAVGGTSERPEIQGDVELKAVAFTVPALLQTVQKLNGQMTLTPQGIIVHGIHGQLDSGRFELAGTVGLEAFRPTSVDLKLNGDVVPVQVPDTMELFLTTGLRIHGTREKSLIEGEIIILEGTYYRDVNLSLLDAVGRKTRKVAPQPAEIKDPFLKNMVLDISVKDRNPFLVQNNLAELDINPDLRITGKLNNPVVRGRAEVESGTVHYRRKNFVVKRGVVDFLNPYKTEPNIDIESEIKVRHWLIGLVVSGTPDELTFKLTSDPPEEDGDILSLLLVGKTTGELVNGEGGASQGPSQMLAQALASTFGDEVKQVTGLDIVEAEAGGDDDPERVRVTLGEELSRRMTVKYAVESKNGETIQRAIAEYKLLENVLLGGFQDTKGIFGGQLQFRLEFR